MKNLNEVEFVTHEQLSQIRDKLITDQNNICPICGRPIDHPVVDHHHISKVGGDGCIRAVICSMCNTFIARSENNCKRHKIPQELLPTVLRNMADYFENIKTNIVHPNEKKKYKPTELFSKSQYNKVEKYWDNIYPRRKGNCPIFPKRPKLTTEWKEAIHKANEFESKLKTGGLRKLGKREISLVEKWYPIMYPKRRKMPIPPADGYINREYEELIDAITKYRNNNGC